jgi:hypothetical protein
VVATTAADPRFDVHVVATRPKALGPDPCLSISPTGQPDVKLAARYCEAIAFADLREEARRAVLDPAPLLLTTALGVDGLAATAPLILELASLRPTAEETITWFVACENDCGEAYPQLRERLVGFGVECRNTMVNRLCPERFEAPGSLRVRVDPYAEWLIEGLCEALLMERLAAIGHVEFVPDVEPYAVRKRWMVNGVHLSLALIALTRDIRTIQTIAGEERLGMVGRLHRHMDGLLPEEWRLLFGDSIEYARQQVLSWCRTEDRVGRILKRMRRADLTPFFRDLDRKLGEPARAARRAAGALPSEFADTFSALHSVLLRFDLFPDAEEVEGDPDLISASVDSRAVAAYGQLLAGIVDPPLLVERKRQLETELTLTRKSYGLE